MRRAFAQWVAWLVGAAEAAAATLFVVAVLLEIVNLFLRWFGGGIPEAAEFSSLVMVAIAFLGMARGFLSDEHARFIAFERRLTKQLQGPLILTSIALNMATLVVVGWLGVQMTRGFMRIGNGGFSMPWMPLWIWAACLPVGAFLSVLALLANVRSRAAGQDKKEQLDES